MGTDTAPMRVLNRPSPSVCIEPAADGSLLVTSGHPYEPPSELLIDYIGLSAASRPDNTFLARRGDDGQWRRLTYRALAEETSAIALWLMERGFGPGSPPVMILSENSIEHAVLNFAALRAGATVVPVSPSYSLSGEFTRLKHVLELADPGLVFAQDATRYAAALELSAAPGRILATAAGGAGVSLGDMRRREDAGLLTERRHQITAETPAKILFTSGSTGMPKGVINTHDNLIAALQMVRQVGEPPDPTAVYTLLDWLPWHHTFGGNVHINAVLRAAGTMYIDDGRPVPGQFAATIANLREISPSAYSSVPAAYPMLADALEKDAALRETFFRKLRTLSYGGALLPQDLWERMQRLAVMTVGERIPFGCGWGMTETAGTGTSVYWNVERTGLLGLPLPGVTLKLAPAGDRLELRIKGPHVMAGYLNRPDLNADAFDAEGFFRTGDAVRWIDPDNPEAGLEFAGRVAEDFKLQSGTWVQASVLRLALLDALQPLAHDVVIAAPDRPYLGALVWLDSQAVADGDAAGVRRQLAHKLAAFNRRPGGGSTHVARLLVLAEPPSVADGEVTDKRSVNQRLVLQRRRHEVERLFREPAEAAVILPGTGA